MPSFFFFFSFTYSSSIPGGCVNLWPVACGYARTVIFLPFLSLVHLLRLPCLSVLAEFPRKIAFMLMLDSCFLKANMASNI